MLEPLERQQLDALFENYFEDNLRANPLLATYIGDHRYDDQLPNSIGPQYLAASRALNQKYLAAIRALDPDSLSPAERISYDIFLYEREREARGERFPFHLLPINQAGSLLTVMPALGSGTNAQPFETVADYERWLQRLDGLAVWMDQAVLNMREGATKGVVQPRAVMEKVLAQLDAMVVPQAQDSQYFAPIRRFPADFSAADRERLTAEYTRMLDATLLPAYRRLRDFVRDEYLRQSRSSVAWTALPDGQAWYAYYVQEHTTTNLTPEQIHALGLGEVKRILGEMDHVRQQVGFKGDLEAFFTFLETDPQFYFTQGADLLDGYRALKTRIDAALPQLFSVFPRADYEVREVEAFRAQSAAGAYYQQPSADGSRPGVFYVNTYNLKAQPKFGMETLSLHEASPGHHFQVSIQQELEGVPRFRRFGGDYTAYVEGWALYAERLMGELGYLENPDYFLGMLRAQAMRAVRVIVDIGMHLGQTIPDGMVLSSTILTENFGRPVPGMPLDKVRIPVLVVHHEQDGCLHCRFNDVPQLMDKLVNAPRKQLLAFKGGVNEGDPCDAAAYHGFNGLEREVVGQTAAWMLAIFSGIFSGYAHHWIRDVYKRRRRPQPPDDGVPPDADRP